MSALRLLLLTEDTGEQAFATQRALAEKMLHLVAEGCAIHQVRFEPGDERTRVGMGFNAYTSTNKDDYRKKVDLAGAIATHLLRDDIAGFVLIHIDGDRRWSERGADARSLCANRAKFETSIVSRVSETLHQKHRPELLERLLYAVPCWSIEAWLYQNSVELLAICAEHFPRHERDVELLREWRGDPARLDEEERPKDRAQTVQDRFNARLARSLPGRKVYDLGLSFAACVDGLKGCGALNVALESLRYPLVDPP
ncbi:MAG: hypothetical protein IPO88_05660 [Nannocystis sp.]|uniref:hypothetical protein n=1 Tax=Nannocystis sp. TaxID=1962667 RepID=UPI002420C255|nr:hypothetical protein [Nannocystis sp.]MBK9752987.1 hypothetical protein [Nannocystis sp.]